MKAAGSFRKTLIAQAVVVAMAGVSSHAMSAVLEEIIVTAQKRAESLQDVPISVSAVDGDKISEAGIQKVQDAVAYIPNVSITQQSLGDNINIRGIQSGNLAGFEQSVGTFVDGVYRGRGVQSRFAFLDVGMLEVLRGPQGTLFGKNVIAGALNITSAKPTEEFEGSITASENVEFKETEYKGYVSGSLSDTVRGRVAFLKREMDEGWLSNERYNTNEPAKDEQAVRVSLDWDLSDNTLLSFKHEDAKWDNSGIPLEHVELGPLAAYAPLGMEDTIDGNTSIGSFPLAPDPVQEIGSSQVFEGDSNETVFTLEHGLDQGTLTAIAAHSEYEFERILDADYSIADLANFRETETFEQKTFEVRFASEQGDNFEYITGAFYQDADLSIGGNSQFNLNTIAAGTAGGCAAGGGTTVAYDPLTDNPNAVLGSAIAANVGTSAKTTNNCGQASLVGPLVGLGLDGFNRFSLMDQNTESWAVFGQFTYHLSDTLRSTFGVRYTEEVKTVSSTSVVADYGRTNETPTTNPLLPAAANLLGEYAAHSFDDLSRDEESLTWSANLQYDYSEETMLYGTISTGFKAGGFNSFYFDRTPTEGEIEFEEEEVITVELGAKMSLLDGAAELNIAMFRTEYDNLQVSVFSGATTFNVANAAKATTQGIEIDSRWQATDQLMLSGSLGLIDFEYGEYANQACTDAQFNEWREGIWATNPAAAFLNNGDCAAAGVNDLSGKTAAQTPEMSASLSANYIMPLGDNLELGMVLDLNYRDDVFRQDDLDEHTLDEAATYVNASLRLNSLEDNWGLALRGNNLTDVKSFDFGIDVPLASGAHVVQVAPPRSYSLDVTYNF